MTLQLYFFARPIIFIAWGEPALLILASPLKVATSFF